MEEKIRNSSVYNDIEPEALGDHIDLENLPTVSESWYKRANMKIIKLLKMVFKTKTSDRKEGAE